jgi:hypothetical protein
METAKTYINSKLDDLVKDVPNLCIQYRFDSLTKEHLIKVLPLIEYENNMDYDEVEGFIIMDFLDKFPFDSLVFFSDKDDIQFGKPDKIFKGNDYQSNNLLEKKCISQGEFQFHDLFSFQDDDSDFLQFGDILNAYTNIEIDDSPVVIQENDIGQEYYEWGQDECCKWDFVNSENNDRKAIQKTDAGIFNESQCICNFRPLAA